MSDRTKDCAPARSGNFNAAESSAGCNDQKDAFKAPNTTFETPNENKQQDDPASLEGSMSCGGATSSSFIGANAHHLENHQNDCPDPTDHESHEETPCDSGFVDEAIGCANAANTRDPNSGDAMAAPDDSNEATTRKDKARKNICSVVCGFLSGVFFLPIFIPFFVWAKKAICSFRGAYSDQSQQTASSDQKPPDKKSRLEILSNVCGILASIGAIVATCVELTQGLTQDPGVEVSIAMDQGDAIPGNTEPVDLNVLVKEKDSNQRVKGLGVDSFSINDNGGDSFVVCETDGCFQRNALYKFKLIPTLPNSWTDGPHSGYVEVETDSGTNGIVFLFTIDAKKVTDQPSEAPSSSPSSMPSQVAEPDIVLSAPPKPNCSDSPCFPGVICTDEPDGRFSCGECPSDHLGDGLTCKRFRKRFDQPMTNTSGSDDPRLIWADTPVAEANNLKWFCRENAFNDIEDYRIECSGESNGDYLDWNVTGRFWRARKSDVADVCLQVFDSITCLQVDFDLPRCSSNPCFSDTICRDLLHGGFECGDCPVDFSGDGIDCIRFRETFERPTAKLSNDSLPLRIWADTPDKRRSNPDGFCLSKGYKEADHFDIACDGQAGVTYLDWDRYDRSWESRSINVTNETVESCYDLFESVTCVNPKSEAAARPEGDLGVLPPATAAGIGVGTLLACVLLLLALACLFIVVRRRRQPATSRLLESDEYVPQATDAGEVDEFDDAA